MKRMFSKEEILAIINAVIEEESLIDATELETTLSSYVTTEALETALSSYVTSEALTTILADYVTSNSLNTTLSSYLLKSKSLELIARIDTSNYTLAEVSQTGQFSILNWYEDNVYFKIYDSSDNELKSLKLAIGQTLIDIRTWDCTLWDATNDKRSTSLGSGGTNFATAKIVAGSTTCFIYKMNRG